jgi:hypothetical protein
MSLEPEDPVQRLTVYWVEQDELSVPIILTGKRPVGTLTLQ